MHASGFGLWLALALCAANVANAAPPAAPQVTMGADLKLLRFDWDPVPGASFYRLWVKPGGTRYIAVGERIPASVTHAEHAIPLHLQNWERLRYVVTACDTSGCAHSEALTPRHVMLDAIGYLKASNTDSLDNFGMIVELSADGYTLAVAGSHEASNATGINGNQSNNSSPGSGAVYVYRRRGNTWQQAAYIKAAVNEAGQLFGGGNFVDFRALALSADGSILAVGAPRQDVNGVTDAGIVYTYRRLGNTWRLMSTVLSPQPLPGDFFGDELDISHDGRTLKVSDHVGNDQGLKPRRAHIYVLSGNTWQYTQTPDCLRDYDIVENSRLSGDGNTLVLSCFDVERFQHRFMTLKRSANAWNHVSETPHDLASEYPIVLSADASMMALNDRFSSVLIFRWNGSYWWREAAIPRGPNGFHWGWDLALADNGRLLAIADPTATEYGAGVSSRSRPDVGHHGAVYLYEHRDDGAWTLRNVVKSPNPSADHFGHSVSLSASGRTLAAGAPTEDGGSTGIDGDRNNENAPESGAAYLY